MAVEIERRFMVTADGWRRHVVQSSRLSQGYLSSAYERVVRVRLIDDEHGCLTVKGARVADRRPEFEYRIPAEDARFMLRHLCVQPLIEKRRNQLDLAPGSWTVDEFAGDNSGLVLAEVEGPFATCLGRLPDWIGMEVTEDDRYANSSLLAAPYGSWGNGHDAGLRRPG